MTQKLKCGLSLDLDNQWTYMKTHGNPEWKKYPTYLPRVVPEILSSLEKHRLKVTFFLVGKDFERPENREMISAIGEAGHEVGNHSFNHDPWLHLLPEAQILREITDTENQIRKYTGQKPVGFRGPGFSWSRTLLQILIENGYRYDASTLPTFLAPIARAYFLSKSKLSEAEKEKRGKLFGAFRDGFRPIDPYWLELANSGRIMEIPVTTMPIFRVPFHLSYLIYLSRFSETLMNIYLNWVIMLCKITGTSPSFLLHPLDFIGGDEVPELAFFPGMEISRAAKTELFDRIMTKLAAGFELMALNEFAAHYLQLNPRKSVKFGADE